MLRAYDATARYVDQGGYKHPGAFAIYIEPWHPDRKNLEKQEARARDLSDALWIPDLLMKRVEQGGKWSLFCPNEAPGLHEMHGAEFVALYEQHEREGRARKTIYAQKLWLRLVVLLCCPRMRMPKQTSSPPTSVQNSLSTPRLTRSLYAASAPLLSLASSTPSPGYMTAKKVVAFNLNCVIDVTYYPVTEARRSNLRHRAIGVGVQGLWDTFMALRIPFESMEAKKT
ncbi:PFL-like glycyl radical enzyme [Ramaria rubella]|nr:PFL-like glycyl radical enzyme [Ramaria rubella]